MSTLIGEKIAAPDLTKTFPRSPNECSGDYVILARTIDKTRADIIGKAGVYHWNCGLAKLFFDFKGIDPQAFREQVEAGNTDVEILSWIETVGTPKTKAEILAWGYDCKSFEPDTLEMKAYVEETLRKLNRPQLYAKSFFQMLDAEEGRL